MRCDRRIYLFRDPSQPPQRGGAKYNKYLLLKFALLLWRSWRRLPSCSAFPWSVIFTEDDFSPSVILTPDLHLDRLRGEISFNSIQKHLKSLIKKFLLWLLFAYLFGYLAGSWVALFVGTHPDFLIPGFFIGLYMLLFLLPIFFALTVVWFKIIKKRPQVDRSWLAIMAFSILVGLANVWVLYEVDFFDLNMIFVAFAGGFFGALLPRFFLKSLKPGNLLNS